MLIVPICQGAKCLFLTVADFRTATGQLSLKKNEQLSSVLYLWKHFSDMQYRLVYGLVADDNGRRNDDEQAAEDVSCRDGLSEHGYA